MPTQANFSGAKIALLCDGQLLTYLRDDKPGIPWPGMWDLPGGGRENDETPLQTAARETMEEFSLTLDEAWVVSARVYPGQGMNGLDTWFLVGQVPAGTFEQIVFGDEGQRWEVISVRAFLEMDGAVVHLQERLREFLHSAPGALKQSSNGSLVQAIRARVQVSGTVGQDLPSRGPFNERIDFDE